MYEIKDDYAEHADARTAVYKHTVEPTPRQREIELQVTAKHRKIEQDNIKRSLNKQKQGTK